VRLKQSSHALARCIGSCTSTSDEMAESSEMIRPAGRGVRLFNDESFRQLREKAGVPDDFVNGGWCLDELESGGAKGGCLMAFVKSEYVVKELGSDDHQSLLAISASYFDHVCNGDTLLGTVFLHFEDVVTGRRFFVMRNVTGSGPFLAMYDLKGCNDDKTLELFGRKIKAANMLISNAGRWCGYFVPQPLYDAGTEFDSSKSAAARVDFVVTGNQREEVMRRIHRDTDWLAQNQLMDYSLIVGIKTGPPGFAPDVQFGQSPLVRSCADGSEVAVCVGIIDFLQKWNFRKIVARSIKCCEFNKATIPPRAYAARFCDYFEDRFVLSKESRATKTSIPSLLTRAARGDAGATLQEEEDGALLQFETDQSTQPVAIGASVFE